MNATDVKALDIFVAHFGKVLCYSPELKTWFILNPSARPTWQRDRKMEVRDMLSNLLALEAREGRLPVRYGNMTRITAVERLAKHDHRFVTYDLIPGKE